MFSAKENNFVLLKSALIPFRYFITFNIRDFHNSIAYFLYQKWYYMPVNLATNSMRETPLRFQHLSLRSLKCYQSNSSTT